MGGASNSDQITDTSGAQKTSSTAPVTMATMMMGGREEMVATPNGSTPPTNDSYVGTCSYRRCTWLAVVCLIVRPMRLLLVLCMHAAE